MQNGGDLQTAGTEMKSRPGILKNSQPLCPTPQDPWERARGEEATHSLQRHPWERARAKGHHPSQGTSRRGGETPQMLKKKVLTWGL